MNEMPVSTPPFSHFQKVIKCTGALHRHTGTQGDMRRLAHPSQNPANGSRLPWLMVRLGAYVGSPCLDP